MVRIQCILPFSTDLERSDLLGVVPPRIEFVEEGLRGWWVVVLLKPVHDMGLRR